MLADQLSPTERLLLLAEARKALTTAVRGDSISPIKLSDYPPKCQELGVVFVTLTIEGVLRGCVGALEANQPLVEDVRDHAVAAGLRDYRFPPVRPEELPEITIEISRLSTPKRLDYEGADDLLQQLRPGIDGVVLKDGSRRATFLPQVWEKLPLAITFLEHLCQKLGASPDLWRQKPLEVLLYQVEEFHE